MRRLLFRPVRFPLAVILVLLMFSPLIVRPAWSMDDGRYALFDVKISDDGGMVAFSWGGDIYIADTVTGETRQITDHVAYDHHPAWFPSGDRIAFSSNRDGNDDVYSVEIETGAVTRHTWHGENDIVLDVAQDGEHIMFRSSRDLFSIDLYEVDIYGGLEHPLTNDSFRCFTASYAPDGRSVYVSRGIIDWTRRDYNGSGDTDIFAMDRDGTGMRWVENSYDGMDYWPCVSEGHLYFVSDRDGCENVYRKPLRDGSADRLTSFDDRPVLFMSVSEDGTMAFVQNFRIWLMDADGSDLRTLDLDLSGEPKHSQVVRTDISGNITEMALSPLGTHLAVIARGELFIITLHDPSESAPMGDERYWEAVRVTETPSREQYVTWHPDGDRVALCSDIEGNFEIYEIDLRTNAWTRLTETDKDEIGPKYSPDGTRIAYYLGNDELRLMDLESGRDRELVDSLFVTQPWIAPFEWSHDGEWIAYSSTNRTYTCDVYVASTIDRPSEPVNITMHFDNDDLCGWSPDDSSIYFLSRRNYVTGLEPYGWWWAGGTLHNIPLENIQPPSSDFLDFGDEGESGDEADEGGIDFERIDERAWQVTHIQGGGKVASLSPDGSTYLFESNPLGGWALWRVPYEGGQPSQVTGLPGRLSDIEWLPDSRGALYLAGNRIYFWEKRSGSVMQVPTYGRLDVDLATERYRMVNEAGRLLRSHFYDEDMHGYDWDGIVGLYAPLAMETAVGEEFELLLKMMMGELDASHLGAWTSGSREGRGYNHAELGLEFDPLTSGPGLKVTNVMPRGPADYEEIDIEAGDWVLEINGTDVSTSMNYWSLLDDMVSRTTVLTAGSEQYPDETWEISILPMQMSRPYQFHPSWGEVAYEAWVDENRTIVEDMSDGRVGYTHIQWMGGSRLERFARELFAENLEKDAMIFDIRWNPGGNIHEYLLEILSRDQFGWSQMRDGNLLRQPAEVYEKPVVLLINERSSSDSEIFPSGFRTLELGTIIGQPTLGAVIGTEGYTLIDGVTGIRLPIEGWYAIDHTNLENYGVPPDIFVENDLNDIRDGVDSQLEYAVEYLMDQLR